MNLQTTAQASPQAEAELKERYEELGRIAAERFAAAEELDRAQGERDAVHRRIDSLDADLQKNKDALKLRELGSVLGSLAVTSVCPTCHQPVDSELLPPDAGQAMGLEENIRFLDSQLRLYRAMYGGLENRVQENEQQIAALTEETSNIRLRIRDLKSALTDPSAALTEASVREKVRIEDRISSYIKLQEGTSEIIQGLVDIASRYFRLRQELEVLPRTDFSANDRAKVERMGSLIQGDLDRFGFTTYDPLKISISVDNFRPFVTIREDNL